MGWKTFKEYFKVNDIVSINDGFILIGSENVKDLIKINMKTGEVIGNHVFDNFLKKYYSHLLVHTKEEILEQINKEDVFENSIKVYTFHNGEILEKYCEKLGWPNATHDGFLMYENYFSTDKDKIIRLLKRNLEIQMQWNQDEIVELEEKLINLEKAQKQLVAQLNQANKLYQEDIL